MRLVQCVYVGSDGHPRSFFVQGVYKIMCSCWEMEPNERPTFDLLQQLLAKNFGEWKREVEGGRKGGRENQRKVAFLEGCTLLFHLCLLSCILQVNPSLLIPVPCLSEKWSHFPRVSYS